MSPCVLRLTYDLIRIPRNALRKHGEIWQTVTRAAFNGSLSFAKSEHTTIERDYCATRSIGTRYGRVHISCPSPSLPGPAWNDACRMDLPNSSRSTLTFGSALGQP